MRAEEPCAHTPPPRTPGRGPGELTCKHRKSELRPTPFTLLENIQQSTVRLVLCLTFTILVLKYKMWVPGLPGGSVVKNPLANVGDTGSIPDPGRSHMPQSS